jgi:hypothetical protein
MTDAEIRQAMKAIAAVNGSTLSDERIERDLPTFKSYLAAMDAIKKVDLPVETEPLPVVTLKSDRRS